jgi:hypothetical protein
MGGLGQPSPIPKELFPTAGVTAARKRLEFGDGSGGDRWDLGAFD